MAFWVHFFIGLLVAFLASLPLGPVNLAVIQTAINRGRHAAYNVAVGACMSEMLYCFMAVVGTNLIFKSEASEDKAMLYLKMASIPLLFALGAYDIVKRVPRPRFVQHAVGANVADAGRFKSGFMLGLALNLLNPVLLPYWLGISSYLRAQNLLSAENQYLYMYVFGVGCGTFLIMATLTWLARRRQHSMRYRRRVYLTRGIGVVFIGFAIYQLFELMFHFLGLTLDGLVKPLQPIFDVLKELG